MTKEKLQELKKIVENQCTNLLESARDSNILLGDDYIVEEETFEITVKQNPDDSKIKELQEFLYTHRGLKIVMVDKLRSSGRYDYFEEVRYKATKYKLADKVPKEVIEKFMKAIVKRKLGVPKYGYIDCKVMSMFKKGLISWEETIALHKEDCKL